MSLAQDLWEFLRERKKWWLAPVIVVTMLVGLLIVFGGTSAIAPFIYTIFSRPLKKAHLRRWFACALIAAYQEYASFGASQTALHLDLFERPGEGWCFP